MIRFILSIESLRQYSFHSSLHHWEMCIAMCTDTLCLPYWLLWWLNGANFTVSLLFKKCTDILNQNIRWYNNYKTKLTLLIMRSVYHCHLNSITLLSFPFQFTIQLHNQDLSCITTLYLPVSAGQIISTYICSESGRLYAVSSQLHNWLALTVAVYNLTSSFQTISIICPRLWGLATPFLGLWPLYCFLLIRYQLFLICLVGEFMIQRWDVSLYMCMLNFVLLMVSLWLLSSSNVSVMFRLHNLTSW